MRALRTFFRAAFCAWLLLCISMRPSLAGEIRWRLVSVYGGELPGGVTADYTAGPPGCGPSGVLVSRTPTVGNLGVSSAMLIEHNGEYRYVARYFSAPDPQHPASIGRLSWNSAADATWGIAHCWVETLPDRPGVHLGLYRGEGAGSLVLRTGQTAPGTRPGETVATLTARQGNEYRDLWSDYPILAADGTLFFSGTLAGPGVTAADDEVLWSNRGGETRLLIREGGKAGGSPGGEALVRVLSHAAIAWNNAVFRGSNGVWFWNGERFIPVLTTGSSVPGIEGRSSVSFGVNVTMPSINAAGEVAIAAVVSRYEPHYAYGMALWRGRPENLELIWPPDQDTSFIGEGTRVALWGWSSPLLAGNGDVLIRVRLEGPGIDASNNLCLLRHRSGNWGVVARSGDLIGVGPSAVRLGALPELHEIATNRHGHIVFTADNALTPTLDTTLIAWTPSAGLSVLLRPGQSIDNDRGTALTVTSLAFKGGSGGQDGRYSGLGDNGRVVVRVEFNRQSRNSGVLSLDLASPCRVDWNTDGGVDGSDLEAFFADWESGAADANHDGGTDGADLESFITAWARGDC